MPAFEKTKFLKRGLEILRLKSLFLGGNVSKFKFWDGIALICQKNSKKNSFYWTHFMLSLLFLLNIVNMHSKNSKNFKFEPFIPK